MREFLTETHTINKAMLIIIKTKVWNLSMGAIPSL